MDSSQHSSEALATDGTALAAMHTAPAPTTINELRDVIIAALRNDAADDPEQRITDVSLIDGEDGVIGVEFADTLYFIEIKEADA